MTVISMYADLPCYLVTIVHTLQYLTSTYCDPEWQQRLYKGSITGRYAGTVWLRKLQQPPRSEEVILCG